MAYKKKNPFYSTKRWVRKREIVLKNHGYACKESKQYGNTKQAEVVHHIYPLEKYPELAYVNWNLLPLTNKIHNTFHDRNNDEIIGRGMVLRQYLGHDLREFLNETWTRFEASRFR